MLRKILYNFSEDELIAFFSRESIDFAVELLDGDDEKTGGNKWNVAGIVASTISLEFVFNSKYRELLIDRLPKVELIKMFPEFELKSENVSFRHYDAINKWAEENLGDFAKRIGLSEEYEDAIKTDATLQSIDLVEPHYSLYPYQKELSDKVMMSIENGEKRILVHLPTGAGKTRTAMNVVSEHLRKNAENVVLWLADREELCEQAYNEFIKAWGCLGDRSLPIYGLYSDSNESLGGIDAGIVVGGLHKFLSIKNKDSRQVELLYKELREKVTLVVFDEAHKTVAKKYQEIVSDFIDCTDFNAYLLGLTATPGRTFSAGKASEEDERLANFYHNNKIEMTVSGYLSPIDYLVENKYLAQAEFISLNYIHADITGYELKGSSYNNTNKALSKNIDRNKQIIEIVKREIESGSQIIIFACTVEHAQNLSIALNYIGISSASIDSKLDSNESRRSKIRNYKSGSIRVLTNYGVLVAGFDAPKTNVAIIAKPTNSLVEYLQMAGRAMRGASSGGNDQCRIYTVIDEIPEFKSVQIAYEYWNEMWESEKEKCCE